jgi:olfactory receptor
VSTSMCSWGLWSCLWPHVLTIVSYSHIAVAVLQIPSAKGRHKAFSKCSSHLSVVTLFYGTVLGIYLQPQTPSQPRTQWRPSCTLWDPHAESLHLQPEEQGHRRPWGDRLVSRGSKSS